MKAAQFSSITVSKLLLLAQSRKACTVLVMKYDIRNRVKKESSEEFFVLLIQLINIAVKLAFFFQKAIPSELYVPNEIYCFLKCRMSLSFKFKYTKMSLN